MKKQVSESDCRPGATAADAPPGGTCEAEAFVAGRTPPTPQPIARTSFAALFSAVMLPMFMGAVDQTLLATATPQIARELGGFADTSWISVGYLLAATVTAPVYGRLGDRFGHRNVMFAALSLFVLGSVACWSAASMSWLIAARILQGLGGGGLMVLSQSLIGDLVPTWDRPRYQGYFAVIFATSSIGGPLLGGFVVNHYDWRWLFLANIPLGLIAGWRALCLPAPVRSAREGRPFDSVGFVLFVVCACAGLLWVGQVGQRFALLSAPGLMLAVVALGAGLALWRQQRRHAHPFLPLDILRLEGVPWVCLTVIAFAGTLFAFIFLFPIYLQVARGEDPVGAGLQLLPVTAGVVLGGVLNGRITLYTGRTGYLPPIGLAVAAVSLLTLGLAQSGDWLTITAAGLCGVGLGTVMPSAQMVTELLAGRERLGAAAALISLTRSAGASIGAAAFGSLAFVLLQKGEGDGLPPALYTVDQVLAGSAFRIVFCALALFAVLGALAATQAPRMSLKPGGEPRKGV